MATSIDYIRKYGEKTFKELPFNEIDNLILCEIFYMPFEKVIDDSYVKEPVNYADACDKVFAYNGYKHIGPGLILSKKISVKMVETAKTKRYSQMKMYSCNSVFSFEPAVQFNAVTFILPTGENVIIYRGTDDSLIGWQEDFDIVATKGIPSHRLAIDYIEKMSNELEGDFIICGHSKGGNIALNTALKCSEKIRNRIKGVYNNDGPGFSDYSFIHTPEYKEILPKYKHFVPSNSFIGMLLAHDNDYTVVRSTKVNGMMQHDASTWKVKDTHFYTKDDISLIAKIIELCLRTAIFGMDDDMVSLMAKSLSKVFAATGQVNLKNFAKNLGSSVRGIANAVESMDEGTKKKLFSIVTTLASSMKYSVETLVDLPITKIKRPDLNFAK